MRAMTSIMILPLDEITKMIEKDNQSIYLGHFQNSIIKAIYLGVNAPETTRDQIANILSEERYRHVVFYEASLSATHYKIEFRAIST